MPVDHAQLRVYDNGGITMDRYTVLRLDWVHHKTQSQTRLAERDALSGRRLSIRHEAAHLECIGMSEQPDHPQGYGQHGTAQDGSHLGKRIAFSDLPERCQRVARHFTEN
jgi:hypothetical protein